MTRRFHAVTALLVVLATLGTGVGASGCGASMKYTYDPAASFQGTKTYQWAPSSGYGPTHDSLLEANVRYLVDRALEQKGWQKVPEQPELLFSMSAEFDTMTGDRWTLRLLELRAVRRDGGKPVWRGAASGVIDTSSTSSDLKTAVNGILSNFPPR